MCKIIYSKVNKSSKPNHLIALNLNILETHNKYLTPHNNNNNLFGIINGISNNLKYSNNSNHNLNNFNNIKYTHNNSNYLIMLNIKINMLANNKYYRCNKCNSNIK
jgi:hypothetical protein